MRKTLNRTVSKKISRNCGRKMMRRCGHEGGMRPRAMVVTITEAVPLPVGKEFGVTEQVVVAVTATGSEQIKLT
jgi:hypothetical protein